jgi:hypothetical protein
MQVSGCPAKQDQWTDTQDFYVRMASRMSVSFCIIYYETDSLRPYMLAVLNVGSCMSRDAITI